jgi:hypothetical protein
MEGTMDNASQLAAIVVGMAIAIGAVAHHKGERELSHISTAWAAVMLWFVLGDSLVSRFAVVASSLVVTAALTVWFFYWVIRLRRRSAD